ncbi:MAG: hypothetical protein AAFO94_13635 [Bacteroidota bacterium]
MRIRGFLKNQSFRSTSRSATPAPSYPFAFFDELVVEDADTQVGQRVYLFNGSRKKTLKPKKDYSVEMQVAYLYIPHFFCHCKVKITGRGRSKKISITPGPAMGQEFSGLVATTYEEKKVKPSDPLGSQIKLTKGEWECGWTYGISEMRNADNMVFHWNKHYFIPFALSNGYPIYYATESKDEVLKWITDLKGNYQLDVAVNQPVYSENILGVMVTKGAELVP